MKKRQRRTFTAEFKRDAVNLVSKQGYSIAEAARNLGIGANLLGRWKQQFEAEKTISESPLSDAERLELGRLRSENERLRMERDILKKATAFFANEKP